jgi:hypothetical protein
MVEQRRASVSERDDAAVELCHLSHPDFKGITLHFWRFTIQTDQHPTPSSLRLRSLLRRKTSHVQPRMSSDSSSSPLSNAPAFEAQIETAVWHYIAKHAAEAVAPTPHSAIFQAAVQYMQDTHNTTLIVSDIEAIVQHGRMEKTSAASPRVPHAADARKRNRRTESGRSSCSR